MRRPRLLPLLAPAAMVLIVACGEGTTRPEPGSVLDIDVSDECDEPGFAATVQPMLQARCATCHRPNAPLGGLSVHDHGSVLAGGNSGPVVMPLDCPGSLMYLVVAGLAQPSMPPTGYERVPASEVACLCAWIADGAADD